MFTQQLGSGTTQNDLASIGMGMPGMMDWSFGTGGNTVNPVQALGNPVGGIQNQGDGVPLPGMPQSANLPDGTGDLYVHLPVVHLSLNPASRDHGPRISR